MNAEELKMAISPVELRDEVTRLNEQVKTLQGYLSPNYKVGDSVDWIDIADEGALRIEVRALRAWRSVADELAEAGAKRIDVMLDLLVAYRTGRHPSERTLNNIPMAEKRWKAALARHAQLKGE